MMTDPVGQADRTETQDVQSWTEDQLPCTVWLTATERSTKLLCVADLRWLACALTWSANLPIFI